MADDNGQSILYAPDEEFPGTLGKTTDDSTEAWPVPKKAPAGVPNVLFYMP